MMGSTWRRVSPASRCLVKGARSLAWRNVALHSPSQSLIRAGGVADRRTLQKALRGALRLAFRFALRPAVEVHTAPRAVELLDREVDDVAAVRALGATGG